jgi:hypothetical protein
MADQGNGGTVVFGTSAFTAEIIEILPLKISRKMLSKNKLTDTGPLKKRAEKQYDAGGRKIRFYYNPNQQPAFDSNTPETMTTTFPIPSGGSAGATEAATGQVTEFEAGGMASNQMMEGSLTFEYDGVTGPTFVDST